MPLNVVYIIGWISVSSKCMNERVIVFVLCKSNCQLSSGYLLLLVLRE